MVKVRALSGYDLESLLVPDVLIDEIGKAFAMYSEGKTVTPPRTIAWIEGNWWGFMVSYVPSYGVGSKIVNIIPKNIEWGLPTINAIAILLDSETGIPLAILNGNILTALRTAAACALSVKYMAPPESDILSIIGTGFQARYGLKFITSIVRVSKLKLFDIDRNRMERFREYAQSVGIRDIELCEDLVCALRNSDIVLEATTATQPVIVYRYLTPPVHIVSIGVRGPEYSTVDEETVAKSEVVAVDSKKAVLEEVADIRVPIEKNLISIDRVVEIGEIVSGKHRGRVGNGVTLFKSVGLAVQDAVAASIAYRKALELNRGIVIEL